MTNLEPSEVQKLVARMYRMTPPREGRQVHRTIKLWPDISVNVEAIAKSSSMPRNEVMNRLMAVGLEILQHHLYSNGKQPARDFFSVTQPIIEQALNDE